jgi:hypothetical protein
MSLMPICDEYEEQGRILVIEGQLAAIPPRKPGRPSRAEMFQRDGPLVLAVIVAQPDGRWCEAVRSSGGRQLRDHLATCSTHFSGTLDNAEIIGFAVVRSWRWVDEAFGSREAQLMAQARISLFQGRKGFRFLEHEFLDSVRISPGLANAVNHEFKGAWFSELLAGRVLAAAKRTSTVVEVAHHRWKDFVGGSVSALLKEWARYWNGLVMHKVVGWPLFGPMAASVICGQWRHDVSALFQKSGGVLEQRWVLAPVQPSGNIVKEFLKQRGKPVMPSAPVNLPLAIIKSGSLVAKWKSGFIEGFTVDTLFLSLRAARHLMDQAAYRKAMKDFGQCVRAVMNIDPHNCMNDSLDKFSWPSKWTLRRHRVTLDIAAMLARRELHAFLGPAYRYIAFDASPQRPGIEVFATGERVVRQRELHAGYHSGQWPSGVEVRRLPLTVLGQGRASLADKVSAHCHQVWLEYGGSLRSIREANVQVRGIISDLGTEGGLGDHVDVLDDIYGHSSIGRVFDHLYPFALVVPGCQHIVDNLCQDAISALPWWGEWAADAKIVCQWLNIWSHREVLTHVWRQMENAANRSLVKDMVKALSTSCDRFAKWRWRTLFNVTTDLIRFQPAVCGAMANIADRSILGQRESDKAQRFISSVESSVFWGRAQALQMCMGPLFELSSWIRGCPCHETERKGKKVHNVQCKWSGCRAPELAEQVNAVGQELQRLSKAPIGKINAGELDNAAQSDIRVLYSEMYAAFQFKFGWVTEAPYTIWLVNSAAAAALFLETHDEAISHGLPVHRVTHYIAGDDAWSLRRDMERYAASGKCSRRLWGELQAYRFCPIDETPIEAVHRDVTRVGVRATAGKIVFKAASMRSEQIFNELDFLGGRFETMLKFWFTRISAIA